ncbi:MAG: hypothetical protein ACK4TA_04130 [Saprospiraceae bacterium]
MTHTVVGIFENETSAQHAARQLLHTGVPQDHIDVTNSQTRSTEVVDNEEDEEGFFTRIGNFFRHLFEDETQAQKYSEFARSRTIVTVHTESDEEAAHAAYILDEHGAMDADQHFSGMSQRRGRDMEGAYVTDQALPISDNRLDDSPNIASGGLRTRSRIFNRPVYKDYRLFGMNFYYDEDDLDQDHRIRGRNY